MQMEKCHCVTVFGTQRNQVPQDWGIKRAKAGLSALFLANFNTKEGEENGE